MITVEPYLVFNGRCEEAFNLYKSVFGGEFAGIMRFKDIPDKTIKIDDSDKEKIVHVALPIGNGILLMGSDSDKNHRVTEGNNIALTLNVESESEAKRIYDELSVGGVVSMPLQKTFWAELYAMFEVKFGINWMINYALKDEQYL